MAAAPVRIREISSDDDIRSMVALIDVVTPDDPTSLEEVRWSDATYPGGARFAADLDGRMAGIATVGRIFVFPPEHPESWGAVAVLPDARRQGVGSALLAAISRHARDAGKTGLQFRTSEARPEGIAFLAHRGYTELERARMVSLGLAGLPVPAVQLPAGLGLTDLGQRPDLVAGVHAVALEAFDDIPGGDTPMAVGDLAEFRGRDVDRPGIPPGAFMVAVEEATDEVVGYASLMLVPGSTTVAWHDMTAVRRAWRGRGIATALKRATIAWAIANGLTALETGNDEENAGMRAVNERLGYRPLPDEVTMRGPLTDLDADSEDVLDPA
ncbi:MAG TPA: GNAT family N-acetyltransferase [Candidatus Saccharimonadales bacterium]|nr:GNAT family N-acetyltransferase [Candidatus Saccharimonadales bacterium]